MFKKGDTKKTMLFLTGLVGVAAVVILSLVRGIKKPCSCKGGEKVVEKSLTDKDSKGDPASKLSVKKDKSGCGC